MKRHKVLDLRTEKGKRIYDKLASQYNSLNYEIDKEIMFSEGYTYVINESGKIIIM